MYVECKSNLASPSTPSSEINIPERREIAAPSTRGHRDPSRSPSSSSPSCRQWRRVRRFIDGGMTAGIGDRDVLARTITVYTDVAAFQRLLAIPSSNDVHALVVDRDGAILARGCGDPDDQSWAAVAAGFPVD